MIPGDGIGKEVTAEAVKVLETIGDVDLHHLPWSADHFLATGEECEPPQVLQAKRWLLEHLGDHYGLYGEFTGVRTARKHIVWAVRAPSLRARAGADACARSSSCSRTCRS